MASTAAAAATARLANRGLVLLLGAAIFLNYVDRGAIAVAAPLMKTELGLSATAFGIAVSAFFWVYAPVQLLVGWLCDRFSVYRLMAGGIILWAASTLLTGFVAARASPSPARRRSSPAISRQRAAAWPTLLSPRVSRWARRSEP
jgi:MFS family permease